jgi:hypothetical protein
LDDKTDQTRKEESVDLARKRFTEAFSELVARQRAGDPSDRAQLEAFVYGILESWANVLAARSNLFKEEFSSTEEAYNVVTDMDESAWKKLKTKGLLQGLLADRMRSYAVFLVDNMLLQVLTVTVTELIKETVDISAMRNTMDAYAEVMGKFKALVESKQTGKPVEEWFNVIWKRQAERGVIQ